MASTEVASAACTTFDLDGDLGVVAFVVPNGELTPLAVRQAAGERLPETMLPDRFVLVADLPLTSSSKVDERRLLQEAGLSPPAEQKGPRISIAHDFASHIKKGRSHADHAPHSDAERTIRSSWSGVSVLNCRMRTCRACADCVGAQTVSPQNANGVFGSCWCTPPRIRRSGGNDWRATIWRTSPRPTSPRCRS